MQIEDITAILRPIKKKCLGLVTGNHEEAVRLNFHYDVGYEIARNLGVRNLGFNGWIRLGFQRKFSQQRTLFKIYVTHGHTGGGKSGSKVTKLEDIAHFMKADLILMGHGHKRITTPPIISMDVNDREQAFDWKQYAVMCGSFLRTYVENSTTYGEKACYAPCDLGAVHMKLYPNTHEIDVTI